MLILKKKISKQKKSKKIPSMQRVKHSFMAGGWGGGRSIMSPENKWFFSTLFICKEFVPWR